MSMSDPLTVSADECRDLVEAVFRRAGLSEGDARRLADPIVEAEFRDRPTHGLIRVPAMAEQIPRVPEGTIRIDRDGGHWLRVDGADQIGYLIARQAVDWAIRRAREHGTSLVAVRRATHGGMIGYYVERAAREGLVALMTANCSPRVAPCGSVEPIFGTNPIAVAVPAEPDPILLDFSTAAVTNGELIVARHAGRKTDPALAFDADGRPTDDPDAALHGGVLPFGGHKGSGLALMTQILAGVLAGAAAVPEPGHDYGMLIAAIDPTIFSDAISFKRDIHALADRIRTSRPAGDAAVRLPGDRAWQARRHRLARGIPVPPSLLDRLRSLT